MKRILISALIICACLTLAGCGTAIPDVTGMKVAESTTTIESAGFSVGQLTYDETSAEATGTVLAQTPEAGKRGKSGSPIDLIIAGPPPVAVPDLLGMKKGEAEAALTKVGLIVGDVTESYDASVSAGNVASQTPEPGAMLDLGLGVAIVVSKGPEPVAVPAVVGKPEAEARTLLESAGFKVKVEQQDDAAEKGTVISIDPDDATAVPGTTVVVKVSTGVALVKVPKVTGMYPDDAAAKLRAAGLTVKEVSIHGPLDDDAFKEFIGQVYRQTPKAGSLVPRGTLVEIRSWWEAG
jgi:serine/threonine-protein kinase